MKLFGFLSFFIFFLSASHAQVDTLCFSGEVEKYWVKGDTQSIFHWEISADKGNIVSGQGTDTLWVAWTDSGEVSVKVKEENRFGCFGEELSIKQWLQPQVQAQLSEADTLICAVDEPFWVNIPIFASNAIAFEWVIPQGVRLVEQREESLLLELIDNEIDSQFVIGILPIGSGACVGDSLHFTVRLKASQPDIELNLPDFYCEGNPIDISASEEVLWFNGELGSSIALNPSAGETYFFKPLENGDCIITDTVFFDLPPANASPDFDFQWSPLRPTVGSTVEFEQFNTAVNSTWNFEWGEALEGNVAENVFSDTGLNEVNLYLEDENGCFDDSTFLIRVYEPLSIYIPNVFSPNDDGINDEFKLDIQGVIAYDLIIYNRWGAAIFETNASENRAWNGSYKGKSVPEGTYMYVLFYTDFEGQRRQKAGSLTLIRRVFQG